MKLTPWFSIDTPPVRNGQYEILDGISGRIRRMNYDLHEGWSDTDGKMFVTCTRDKWRGLLNGGKE